MNDEAVIPSLAVRIYYEDTDAGGVVYYARYLAFAERARGEWFRTVLCPQDGRLWKEGEPSFVVRHLEVDYQAPARLDDVLAVETALTHVGGASLGIAHAIVREGVTLCRMKVALVCVDGAGKVLRIPPKWRQTLLPCLVKGA